MDFSETDMAGIVHFSNFYKWMDAAESAFLEKNGFSFVTQEGSKFFGWPRVHASCDFKKPLRFRDEVEIKIEVYEVRNHSMAYDLYYYKVDEGKKEEVARGKLVSVYAKFDVENRSLEAVLLPKEMQRVT